MEQLKADVVVVGGGPSGFGAAISAAREGARVILVEEDAMLGGSAVDYGVQAFSPGIVCGVNQEIRDILAQKDYTFKHTKSAFNSHWYAYACNLLASRESNLTVLTHTTGIGVLMEGDRVTGVVVQTRGGGDKGFIQRKIQAHVVIDCSGDGDVAVAAGAEFRYGREAKSEFNEPHAPDVADRRVQQCTWMYKSRRIDPNSTYVPDFDYNRDIGFGEYLHWGCQVECEDTTDAEALARRRKAAMPPNLRPERNGFCRRRIASKLGVRVPASWAVIVTENDCNEGAAFRTRLPESAARQLGARPQEDLLRPVGHVRHPVLGAGAEADRRPPRSRTVFGHAHRYVGFSVMVTVSLLDKLPASRRRRRRRPDACPEIDGLALPGSEPASPTLTGRSRRGIAANGTRHGPPRLAAPCPCRPCVPSVDHRLV